MSASSPTTPPIPADHVQLKGSERRPSPNAKLLGPADPDETFRVTIVLRRRVDGPPIPDFDYFAKTPLSQRRRMPEDEFAANYGAAPDDIAKVVDFANGQKLTVVETHAARRTVVVSGTVERMSATFAVAPGRYERIMNLSQGKMPRWRFRSPQAARCCRRKNNRWHCCRGSGERFHRPTFGLRCSHGMWRKSPNRCEALAAIPRLSRRRQPEA
jgi:hypothetical protein